LFTLSKTDATPTLVLTLGNGGDGEAIGYNPEDGLIYHASGLRNSNILETINPVGLAVTNVPYSGDAMNEVTGLVDNGPAFLAVNIEARLYSITDAGVVSLIGNLDHRAKGLAFAHRHRCGVVPVGGLTSFFSDPGSSSGFALLAGGVAAIVAITAGGWYTRRRWLGS